jgi:hypothetical protein
MRYNFSVDGPAPDLEVTVSGVPVTHVIAFDADAGWVEHYKLNALGQTYVENDEAATELLRGKVEFRRVPAPA